MIDDSKTDGTPETAAPEELDAKDLDQAAGGWGKSMYHSYSSESAAFRHEDTSKGDA